MVEPLAAATGYAADEALLETFGRSRDPLAEELLHGPNQ
jgi:hypothetical protein